MDFADKLNAFWKELSELQDKYTYSEDGGFYDPRVRALQIAKSVVESEMSAYRHGKSDGEGK